MSVDWSQFRDGDKIRVSFEGVWRSGDDPGAEYRYLATGGLNMHIRGSLSPAASAELIERPFTPLPAGKLFRSQMGVIYISAGESGYHAVRGGHGEVAVHGPKYSWAEDTEATWLAGIEMIDV